MNSFAYNLGLKLRNAALKTTDVAKKAAEQSKEVAKSFAAGVQGKSL